MLKGWTEANQWARERSGQRSADQEGLTKVVLLEDSEWPAPCRIAAPSQVPGNPPPIPLPHTHTLKHAALSFLVPPLGPVRKGFQAPT